MSVQVTKLKNGLRVVSHNMPYLETVSLGVWVRAGSRDETPAQDGMAHFLEHMAFKGTKTRSAYDIVELIETAGGDLNASTGLDQTAYYATMLAGDLGLAVELLADIVINPVFEPGEIDREIQVIIQEILATTESPEDVVFDLAQMMAFPDQAVGRTVMGSAETVSKFTRDDLKSFMAQHYRASNMVIGAAGAVDHDALCDLVDEHFAGLPTGDGARTGKAKYQGGIDIAKPSFEQGHVVIGFEGIGFTGDEIFAAQILNNTLGGGMSSRLFQEIREKRGLAYQVYSYHSSYEDSGLFGVYAATDSQRSAEVTGLMLNEIANLCTSGISSRELMRAKAQLKSGLAMSLESSGARAEQIARQILFFDRPLSNEELMRDVERVSLEDCQRLAQKIVASGAPTIAVAGSGQNIDEFARFKSFFSGDRLSSGQETPVAMRDGEVLQ